MEILRIISIGILTMIDFAAILTYIIAGSEKAEEIQQVALVMLIIFIIPTMYIIMN